MLRLIESGYHEAEAVRPVPSHRTSSLTVVPFPFCILIFFLLPQIWDQLAQQGGNRKNLDLVRAKRLQLAQKAAGKGLSIIEVLRDEVLKMEASGIPAESGLMDDEPVIFDTSVSISDVPVEPAGFGKNRRPGRPKRPTELVPPAATAPKISVRPSVRFTAASGDSQEFRGLLSELRQTQEATKQILSHQTQILQVLFREIAQLKTANKYLLQHAGLPTDFLSNEIFPSLVSEPLPAVPPNSLSSSYAIEAPALHETAVVEPVRASVTAEIPEEPAEPKPTQSDQGDPRQLDQTTAADQPQSDATDEEQNH